MIPRNPTLSFAGCASAQAAETRLRNFLERVCADNLRALETHLLVSAAENNADVDEVTATLDEERRAIPARIDEAVESWRAFVESCR